MLPAGTSRCFRGANASSPTEHVQQDATVYILLFTEISLKYRLKLSKKPTRNGTVLYQSNHADILVFLEICATLNNI